MVQLLAARGADLKALSTNGQRPLARTGGHLETALTLIRLVRGFVHALHVLRLRVGANLIRLAVRRQADRCFLFCSTLHTAIQSCLPCRAPTHSLRIRSARPRWTQRRVVMPKHAVL